MKKLILTITMAVAGLGGLASSAQALGPVHPFHPGPFHGGGFRYCYHNGHRGYWYWNTYGYWQFVVVPVVLAPAPCP
jgi:hypothetical protein